MAERFPEEFVDTNLHGTWNVLRRAPTRGRRAGRRRLDRQGGAGGELLRAHQALHRAADRVRAGAARAAAGSRCGFVNVLGSAGSASELFLRQARAGVPLTVTDTGMIRYWITMAHATTLLAHGALLAERGHAAGRRRPAWPS